MPNKPVAEGTIQNNKGSVVFPDDGTLPFKGKLEFEFDPKDKTIYWGDKNDGNKWVQVEKYPVLYEVPEMVYLLEHSSKLVSSLTVILSVYVFNACI